MSTDTSSSSGSTTTDTQPVACVQYGFPEEKESRRSPKLHSIYDPIPDDASTASPIYRVSRSRFQQQDTFESGYEVAGIRTIAKEIQNHCEEGGKVLYPVHIESDEYHEVGPGTLIKWFRQFVEDTLNLQFPSCTLYFSGRRSIHVHVPRFVSGEDGRESLKEAAEAFCEDTEAEFDCGIYNPKGLFRLPGVVHSKTGLSKVKIEATWDHDEIVRAAHESSAPSPESYAEVLREVYAQESLIKVPLESVGSSQALFHKLDPERTKLEFTSAEEQHVETLLIEQEAYPEDDVDVPRWSQYNAKEFSPYALAAGNPRSVAAIRVKGGAFARASTRYGATMVPAYFYGAMGCSGKFTKQDEHAPLQLSKPDYRKWEFEPGDALVIIGGKSGSSRLIDVSTWEAQVIGHALTGEGGSRKAALEHLVEQGYDVGSAGSSSNSSSQGTPDTREDQKIWPARDNPQSVAEDLQRSAEHDSVEALTHTERIKVACRLLRYGWEPTWEWFEREFGPSFKPEISWKFLKGIVEDPDFAEYNDIHVPDRPF